MLFVMRNGINPMWEDPKNKDGGCFSYKISNKNVILYRINDYNSKLREINENNKKQQKIRILLKKELHQKNKIKTKPRLLTNNRGNEEICGNGKR